jgi:hypothetical protein
MADEPASNPLPAASPPQQVSDLHKLQFDYAWKWFSYHADQRVKMFNFMLVVLGIFAAGVVNAFDKTPNIVTAILCFFAAGLAVVFTFLDRRNRDLVWLGEDVLTHLERKAIFGESVKIQGRYDQPIDFGILWRQALEEESTHRRPIRDALRDALGPKAWRTACRDAWLGKHRIWLRLVGFLIAVLFLAAGIWILKQPPRQPARSSALSGHYEHQATAALPKTVSKVLELCDHQHRWPLRAHCEPLFRVAITRETTNVGTVSSSWGTGRRVLDAVSSRVY